MSEQTGDGADALSSSPSENTRFGPTLAQLSIWLDQAIHQHRPVYSTGEVLSLSGPLEVAHLETAVCEVVAETDALRLRFTAGPPILQEVVDGFDCNLAVRDFSTCPATAVRSWIERLFREPLEPTDFPLFRFALAKVAPDHFIWLQKYHHLIIDATGRQMVLQRLASRYDSIRKGQHVRSPFVGSYRAAKEAEDLYLASDQYGVDQSYWMKRFTDPPDPIVGSDPRLTERLLSGRPNSLGYEFTNADAAKLGALVSLHGVSEFKIILTLIWICFCRLYQRQEIVIGVPLANRRDLQARQTVGMYSKVMPFRMKADQETPISEIFRALDRSFSRDLLHSKFPTEHIGRDLRRRRSHQGLFDIAVNYVRMDYDLELGEVLLKPGDYSQWAFTVPWGIRIEKHGNGRTTRLVIDYDHGRVAPEEAERFLRSFRGLLSHLPESANLSLARMPVGPAMAASDVRDRPAEASRTLATSVSLPAIAGAADEIERGVIEIWQACLEGREVELHDDYFELGGGSLGALVLIAKCNERFGVDLPLNLLFEHPTPFGLAAAIRSATNADQNSLLVRLKRGNGGLPLLLVHPVGGTLFCYQELVSRLPKDLNVYGLRASGLEAGEPLPSTVKEMADTYFRIARETLGSKPWHLAGWSFGGIVAVEIGRMLAAEGNPPASLTLIDTPSRPRPAAGPEDSTILSAVASALGLDVALIDSSDRGGSMTETISSAAAQRSQFHVSDEQIERILRIVRNIKDIRARHVLGAFPGCATLLRASSEGVVDDPEFDWSGIVEGTLKVFSLPATHHTILKPPHLDQVARILGDAVRAD